MHFRFQKGYLINFFDVSSFLDIVILHLSLLCIKFRGRGVKLTKCFYFNGRLFYCEGDFSSIEETCGSLLLES